MNNTFNMFHAGAALSPLEWICMQSFLRHGHPLNLYCYEAVEVPDGVRLMDASEILPESELFHFDSSPSAFSNIFRYKLLLERGGWWVDTDIICLSDQIPECDYAWSHEDPTKINGAILRYPLGDDTGQKLLDLSRSRARNLTAWGQLGPILLTEILEGPKPRKHLGTPETFYPIHWLETHMLWMKGAAEFVHARLDGALFLHLWNSVFYKMGIDPKCRPPRGSFLGEILQDQIDRMPESPRSLARTTEDIRVFLDLWPAFRRLYEHTMGRNWSDIYPARN